MRAIVTTLLLIALGAGGYYLYQDPRVSDLFKPLGKGPQTPSRANQRSRENEGLKKRQTRQQRATGPTRAQEVVETGPEQHQNQVPNGQVSRVLRQILLAKKLGSDVSLGVNDQEIVLSGTVRSEEEREEILSIIEKAREAREVNAAGLELQPY